MPYGVRYTDELGTAICKRLARGESLRKMCAEPGYPDRHTIARWTREHPDVNAGEKMHRRAGVKMHHGGSSQGHVQLRIQFD